MPGRLLNRELSWLEFNRRVLALAHEPGIPLLERLKFVAICSSNLDEFFQVRISALKDQVAAGVAGASIGGLSPSQQLAAIGPNVEDFVIEQEKALLDVLLPELAEQGVQAWSGGTSSATTTAIVPRRCLRAADLPGAHAARRRSGAPVSVHLQPRAQPGGDGQRSRYGRAPLRPGQDARRSSRD